jgi:hypothetical protein
LANTLLLNQQFQSVGLPSYTYTVTSAGLYNVIAQVTMPQATSTGASAGTGISTNNNPANFTWDGGYGMLGGYSGAGSGAQLGPGQGNLGLGSGQTTLDGAQNSVQNGAAVTSGVSIVIQQNGSTKYTSTAPTVTQSALQFKYDLSCATSDVITVTFSSSNSNDSQLQAVKSVVAIQQGI